MWCPAAAAPDVFGTSVMTAYSLAGNFRSQSWYTRHRSSSFLPIIVTTTMTSDCRMMLRESTIVPVSRLKPGASYTKSLRDYPCSTPRVGL